MIGVHKMPYKDKDKQKEANRLKAKRYRDNQKGVTQGVTITGGDDVIGKPGDADYNGCMIEVDGVWQQKQKHDIPLADYSREMLDIGLQSYRGDAWINSPEHKELMQRLSSMTIDELIAGGYSVPAWKRAQAAKSA